MKTLGQRIYYARVCQGPQKQVDFGKAVSKAEGRDTDYHANTVIEWEHNRSIPTLGAVVAISKASGVDLVWLITGVGSPIPRAA